MGTMFYNNPYLKKTSLCLTTANDIMYKYIKMPKMSLNRGLVTGKQQKQYFSMTYGFHEVLDNVELSLKYERSENSNGWSQIYGQKFLKIAP